jgi:hypothetical protein
MTPSVAQVRESFAHLARTLGLDSSKGIEAQCLAPDTAAPASRARKGPTAG